MPKNKGEAKKVSGNPKEEAWIQSVSEILKIDHDEGQEETSEEAVVTAKSNGVGEDVIDGSGSTEPQSSQHEESVQHEPIPDLSSQIRRAQGKFQNYRKRRQIFKDIRDLEIFDKFIENTDAFLSKAEELNKQHNISGAADALDSADLSLKEIEKTYARGVASACTLLHRKQELAETRARLKYLASFDVEAYSQVRQEEFGRLTGLVGTLADKAEAQLKAGEIKDSRKTFLDMSAYLGALEATLKVKPTAEIKKEGKEKELRAYTGDNSVADSHEVLMEVHRLNDQRYKIPYTDKEGQERLKQQIDAARKKLENSTHKIASGSFSATFSGFEKLGDNGKPVIDDPEYDQGGNKIHMSVQIDQLQQAGNILTPLLLSPDNPFLSFKVTSLQGAQAALDEDLGRYSGDSEHDKEQLAQLKAGHARITQGAQITLYPFTKDTSFPDGAEDFAFFLKLMEQELEAAGIQPGNIPDSDAGLEGMSFATFRNEEGSRGGAVGGKELDEENQKLLKSKPFYQALTSKEPK